MGRVTRRIASAAMLIVAVLALVACGDGDTETSKSDRSAYAQQVNEAQTTFAATVSSVAEGTTSTTSISEQRRTLRRFESAIDGVVRDLRDIDPPSEVTAEHAQLVGVLSSFGRDIGGANEAMRNPTPRSLESAKQRVAAATQSVNTRVNAAIAAINAKLSRK